MHVYDLVCVRMRARSLSRTHAGVRAYFFSLVSVLSTCMHVRACVRACVRSFCACVCAFVFARVSVGEGEEGAKRRGEHRQEGT